MEVPVVVDTFTDDVSGVTYYRVRYSDGRLEDMTLQQFEYLQASAEAVDDLDVKESTTVQPEEPAAPAEPAQNITESPDLQEFKLSFEFVRVSELISKSFTIWS